MTDSGLLLPRGTRLVSGNESNPINLATTPGVVLPGASTLASIPVFGSFFTWLKNSGVMGSTLWSDGCVWWLPLHRRRRTMPEKHPEPELCEWLIVWFATFECAIKWCTWDAEKRQAFVIYWEVCHKRGMSRGGLWVLNGVLVDSSEEKVGRKKIRSSNSHWERRKIKERCYTYALLGRVIDR